MSMRVQKVLLLVASTLGIATALDCLSCTWDAKNDTVDDDCLGAPYKLEVESCPEPKSPGERYACQTEAVFNTKNGAKSLESLVRKCAQKHSTCNNACLIDVDNCWLCCDDQNQCNSFPLWTSLDLVSSAPSPWQHGVPQALFVLAALWSFGSLLY